MWNSKILLDGHTTIIGFTGSGKTYSVLSMLSELKKGVLYYNSNHSKDSDMPRAWNNKKININTRSPMEAYTRAIRAGEKLQANPPYEKATKEKYLKALIDLHMKKSLPVVFAVDEIAQFQSRDMRDIINQIAEAGRAKGINGIFINQRMARMDNTLFTNSSRLMFFRLTMEQNYLKQYNLKQSDINQMITSKGQYSFCVADISGLHGAYKV